MDPNLVYAKTAAGEQAVQERTRLVQRNLRNVLIMVDGRSSVQELCDKVGKAKVVRSALEQLQRDGYIEAASGPASVWEKGVQVAGEIAGAASEKLAGLRAPVEAPPAVAAPVEPPAVPPAAAELNASPFAVAPPPSPFASTPPDSPFALPASKSVPAPAAKPPGGVLAVFKTAREDKGDGKSAAGGDDEKIVIKPIRRGASRRGPGALGWSAIAVVGLLLLLVVGAIAFPYGMYRADIEAALGKSFGQPVRLGKLGGTLGPLPTLVAEQVEIGDAAPVTVGEIRATLTFGSIFGGPRIFSQVLVNAASIPAERLPLLVAGLQVVGSGEAYTVRQLRFNRATIRLRDLALANLAGELSLAEGRPQLRLANADSSLKLEFAAGAAGVDAGVELLGWKPVDAGRFVWDALSIKGTLTPTGFVGSKLEGRLFDGTVQGQMRFDWQQTPTLSGEIVLERGNAKRLRDALAMPIAIDGELGGRARIAASSDTIAALADKARLDGEFRINRGGIEAVDIVEAVRRGGRSAVQGGATRFDHFAGRWSWDGAGLRLSGIDAASAAMQTGGSVTVASGQLAGNLDVRLKGSASDLRLPVSVSGPLRNPQLLGGR